MTFIGGFGWPGQDRDIVILGFYSIRVGVLLEATSCDVNAGLRMKLSVRDCISVLTKILETAEVLEILRLIEI